MARGVTAEQRLRIIAELETRGIKEGTAEYRKEMLKLQAATTRASKANNRMGQSFTQLAYLVDDAQYGFRGVQNNLQAIAVTAGASGPVVLGLTAMTVALGYLIENTDIFKSSANELQKELKGLTEELDELRKQYFGDTSVEDKIAEKWDDIIDKQDEYIKSLKRVQGVGGFGVSTTAQVGSRSQIAFAELQQTINREAAKQDQAKIDANNKLAEQEKARLARLKQLKDQENISEFASELGLGTSGISLEEAFGNQNFNNLFGLQDLPEVIDESVDSLEDLESALIQSGSALAGLSVKNAEAVLKAREDYANLKESIVNNFAGTLISAFESAAAAGGNFLQTLGSGLLSAMGSLLIQIGTAGIISGKARVAAGDVTGAAAIAAGKKSVAAGIILKAGGSLLGRAGSGGTGGAASNASRRSQAGAAITPVATQGSGRNGLIIRGQDLRYIGQAAADSYRGLN